MARGNNRRKMNNFAMTPQLEDFKYEVAQEIGIAHRLPAPGKMQSEEMKAQGETGR